LLKIRALQKQQKDNIFKIGKVCYIKEMFMIKDTAIAGEFHPFPSYTDRRAWEALPEEIKAHFCSRARELAGREWPSLPAVFFMDFYRNGSRTRYETLYFGRRRNLTILLLAECIEGKGAYLDEIINGVWLICEESSWVLPGHLNNYGPVPIGLPDIERDIYVDLDAAETGSLLSWIYYFLAGAIAERSPLVKRRIELEVERRVLAPILQHDDYWWMGLTDDKPPNNWNPWINSNVLIACLVFSKTFPRAQEGVSKTIRIINRFIRPYPEDGGCDEGPTYFTAAGASLYDFIEELGQVAEVSYLYRDPKIHNILTFLYKVYIAHDYYVNYADGAPRSFAAVDLLDRAGRNTGDENLRAFASYLKANQWDASKTDPDYLKWRLYHPDYLNWRLYRFFADLFTPSDAPGKPFHPPLVSWFPGIQVVTAREGEDTERGFFFSAKGGHNAESHNHNDIGNFILYHDGRPVLIDAGFQTYTKTTFSEKRYTIWNNQSCYHNTPTINGADQAAGREHGAAEVSFNNSGRVVSLGLDIGGAYPGSAALQRYRREFVFTPGTGLELTDIYALKEWKAPLALNFLYLAKPDISGDGAVLGEGVVLRFDGAALRGEIEAVPLEDPKIRDNWRQDTLYRLRLIKQDRELSGRIVLKFLRK
jgi:hypothetical protein